MASIRERQYPEPGTNAERVYHFIVANDGTSTNAIIGALRMNASVVRKCLSNLTDRGKIVDRVNSGIHSWSCKETVR